MGLIALPQIIGGLGLIRHKEWARILILVLAFLSLVHVPFGTALGIYTMIILFNPETVRLFQGLPPAPSAPPEIALFLDRRVGLEPECLVKIPPPFLVPIHDLEGVAGHGFGLGPGHDHDPVAIGHDDIARNDQNAAADDGPVDGLEFVPPPDGCRGRRA